MFFLPMGCFWKNVMFVSDISNNLASHLFFQPPGFAHTAEAFRALSVEQ